ncbi:hypothetical protein LTR36_000550 [Oleoguttula mirabilis]|uniref:Sialidase n=1 Tax=Oleoguttula mirabilis TaxID=1507867 RepID=A0AAV9JQ72_9PEZI|nr:hypothetical protein LTR36_000550 [Oleoguttula mirabilis]
MEYQQLTPPPTFEVDGFDDMQCPGGSASTVESDFPQDWSPETVMTAATTPPRSPPRFRECGPVLLPKVRPQDQLIEPTTNPSYYGHSRTVSMPTNGFPMQFGGHLPLRPSMDRRSTSPPSQLCQPSPASAPSPFDHMINDHASSRRPSIGNVRSRSMSNVRSHSRNGSSSSIDASMLSRYGYPTYRQSPAPQPSGNGAPVSRTPSAMSHLAPIAMSDGQIQSYPQRRRTASPPANRSRLSTEVDFDPVLDLQTSTALEYLTAPNPTPSLTQRVVESGRGLNTHFWYDIRNVRAWTDFNVSTIAAIPQLLDLMRFPVTLRDLPTPSKTNVVPETAAQLVEVCATHHAVKVNAALKLTQGSDKHIAMRTLKSIPGSRQQPEFVSNYQSDAEKTIYGDGRGRVVGIVKCYDQWNSGMRTGTPVKYLEALAHLHRFMREHGTRYGFIMNEIELVCVRAGGTPSGSSNVPLFGYLEVATPIQVATSRTGEGGELRMTAGLALWWLHMLAKEQPFPGQLHWRMDVGGPAALTRKHHLPRDDWMPKCVLSEKREARRIRGWVFPDEPLSKRECGRGKRAKA